MATVLDTERPDRGTYAPMALEYRPEAPLLDMTSSTMSTMGL